ncbi:radial spoke head protein 3 [Musca autumnalis]|uniref:radial spoke head protein 3 n=1 Tax=Musca autumnalis TaxID=221902 RepID=UPI003CF805E3
MQNVDYNKENENPQHFPSNPEHVNNEPDNDNLSQLHQEESLSQQPPPSSITEIEEEKGGATRPKFSFASDYKPPRNFTSSFAAPTAPSASYLYDSSYPLASSSSLSAFTVLNNNDYTSSLSYLAKPNAIVHPIRRSEETALPKNSNVLGRDLRITGYPANVGLSVTHPTYNRDVQKFAEELKRKLSSLDSSIAGNRDQSLSRFKNSSQNGSNQETLNQRPLFITTVPRGIFLPPPNEVALISPTRKRQLYAYSSHPVVYKGNNNEPSSSSPALYYQHQHHFSRLPYPDQTQIIHKIITRSQNNQEKPQQQHQQQQHYTNRNSSITMAKDKYSNTYTTTGSTTGKRGGAADSGRGGDSGGVGVSIANADKDSSKSTLRINGVRGPLYASSLAAGDAISPPLLGGINITKQQFQQQLELNRSKRETPPAEPYKNIMYDRRVVRGSNYGTTNALLSDYDPFDKAAELRRRQALRKKNVSQRNQRNVLGTPPPVSGRRHEDVQTDKYLEELVSRPPEQSVETQTDLFLEKPPTPPYVPAKIGVDVATEICDGELFQFDEEAQPIIDALVDSTLELSILEVAHEREIKHIRDKQAELLAQREAELAELRRLEAEEIRLQAEKERRLRQDQIAKSLDNDMQQEVTAAKLLQGHIASILPEILDNLEPATDATKREKLMETLCPWLSAEVAEEVGHIVDSREILTVIIQEIIKQRAEIYADYKEPEASTSPKIEPSGEEEHEATLADVESCETDSHQEAPSQDV